MSNNIIILMTATITPNTSATLKLKDPVIRKKQYIDAINYYLDNTKFRIVFTENSGYSLKPYFTSHLERIEFLTFISPNTEPDKGKGFKEMEILNYTMNNSKFIEGVNTIIKVTGRLKILNIKSLVKQAIKWRLNDEIVNCSVYKRGKIDARCFIFSNKFWSKFKLTEQRINIKYPIEKALWDTVVNYKSLKDNNFKITKVPLRVWGVNAGYGTTYNHGTLRTILKQLKHTALRPYYNYHLEKN